MTLHDFTFTRSFVVDSAKVEHSVDYHAQQFAVIALPRRLSVRAHGIERNQHITADALRRRRRNCRSIRRLKQANRPWPTGFSRDNSRRSLRYNHMDSRKQEASKTAAP